MRYRSTSTYTLIIYKGRQIYEKDMNGASFLGEKVSFRLAFCLFFITFATD